MGSATYPVSWIALRIRARVASGTRASCSPLSLSTNDTVVWLTPARRAMSFCVIRGTRTPPLHPGNRYYVLTSGYR